jgi:hydrogenase maturation factor
VRTEITNRLLFFKYAIPCAETLVKRGILSKQELEKMLENVKKGKEPEKDSENVFKVALAHLSFIAKQNDKNVIDEDTIREYFLFNHDKVVDDRFEEMQDFNPEACRTNFGIVNKTKNDTAIVETPVGIKPYKSDFVKDLEADDLVVVHRDFIVEKISEDLADKLSEKMEKHS